jgi:hypothetical protein
VRCAVCYECDEPRGAHEGAVYHCGPPPFHAEHPDLLQRVGLRSGLHAYVRLLLDAVAHETGVRYTAHRVVHRIAEAR